MSTWFPPAQTPPPSSTGAPTGTGSRRPGTAAEGPLPSLSVPGVRLVKVLGRGGFATVYAGVQDSLERPVAVKVDSRCLDEERNRRRFLREVQAASRISSHPHVVSLVDTGVLSDGRPYLVMEMCAGGSLDDLIDRGPLPAADAVALVEAVASALGAAHAAGVTHRDVKPANILLDSYGSPRLSDFGIASIERDGRDPTVTLDCLTPDYAAPEAFRLSRPGPAGDVWSVGAVLFTLLTTRGPRRGPDGVQRSLTEIVRDLDKPLDLDDPLVPGPLLPLLARAMAPSPDDRFASGRELTAALAQVRKELGTGSMLVGGPLAQLDLARAGLAPAPPPRTSASQPAGSVKDQDPGRRPAPPESSSPAGRLHRRARVRAAAAGLALTLLLGALVGWVGGSLARSRTHQEATVEAGTAEPTTLTPTAGASEVDSSPPFAVGTCLSGIVSLADQSTASQVDCAEPHSWEVFAVGTLADTTTGTTDSELQADPQVQATCTEEAARQLGVSNPDVTVLGPAGAGEAAEHARGFSCLVSGADDAQVTGAYTG